MLWQHPCVGVGCGRFEAECWCGGLDAEGRMQNVGGGKLDSEGRFHQVACRKPLDGVVFTPTMQMNELRAQTC